MEEGAGLQVNSSLEVGEFFGLCVRSAPASCALPSSSRWRVLKACRRPSSRKDSVRPVNVLSIKRMSVEDRAKIEAVDAAIQFTDAGGWFDGEIRETWPAFTSERYLAPGTIRSGTRAERDHLLAEAEIILGG